MQLETVTLDGSFVRLEPLGHKHLDGLRHAILDGDLWKLFVSFVPHPDRIDQFLDDAQNSCNEGNAIAFATIDKISNKVAGSTRLMRADFHNKRIEIGFTFLGKTWQRTRINTESKLLMLTHAFESLRLNRVEFRTDYFNRASRQAILRLGAKEEGILRSHMVMPDGRVRDSVIYSVTQDEWPGVKQLLSHHLTR